MPAEEKGELDRLRLAARRCGARKLWLMHHAPGRTDVEVDALAAEAAAQFPGAVFPVLESMTEVLHE